jgi:hypothetical protein
MVALLCQLETLKGRVDKVSTARCWQTIFGKLLFLLFWFLYTSVVHVNGLGLTLHVSVEYK